MELEARLNEAEKELESGGLFQFIYNHSFLQFLTAIVFFGSIYIYIYVIGLLAIGQKSLDWVTFLCIFNCFRRDLIKWCCVHI